MEFFRKNANRFEDKEEERLLFIVTDSQNEELLKFMREHNVNVSSIYDEISQLRRELISRKRAKRVAIIETGHGMIANAKSRVELIDILDTASEETLISLFVSDSTMEKELEQFEDNQFINIHEYKGMTKAIIDIIGDSGNTKIVLGKRISNVEEINREELLNFSASNNVDKCNQDMIKNINGIGIHELMKITRSEEEEKL